jgi:hypothetical protein
MLSTEDLFVYVYVLIDDLTAAGAIDIPARPGPAPACSDVELLAIALVRHLLGRRSEAGFLAEVARLPEDDCQQIDTSALPVKHPSRVRGPDGWDGPNGLVARFGRDGAHAEWFYGFRLAIKTDLGSRIVRAWGIVPAAVNERDVAADLLEAGPPPRDLPADKGFNGKAFATQQAARGTAVLVPPTRDQRRTMPPSLQKIIAEWRNRVEATFGEITNLMELARHGAHTFWGLLTRTAATIAAHALLRACLADLVQA